MGEVWAAVDDANGGGEVAIKVLLQRAAMKPDLVKRFEREARITNAINSPYVCKLLRVDQADDGAHLLIFEHLTGESLADRLKREQYLPLGEVGPMIEDVLEGLSAAHAANVIHRDLKPGNIFVERTGDPENPERAKILDFGISKLTAKEKEEPTLTAFDATLGSFAYMAPEQIRGAARADERADIYAVGAVAFRALSGRLPFEGTTAAVLVSLKLDRTAPSLEQVTGEKWPAGVERFLERALDRNRESRFKSAVAALEAWRATQPRNITKASIPSSRSSAPRSAVPIAPPRPPAVSYAGAGFPEDMPTEVDDSPPTMTGDHSFPGYVESKSSLNVQRPRRPPSDKPTSMRRPMPPVRPSSPGRPPAYPGTGGGASPSASQGSGEMDPKGGGTSPRSKRLRNGGR